MLNVLGSVGIYITQKSLQINDNDMIILIHFRYTSNTSEYNLE